MVLGVLVTWIAHGALVVLVESEAWVPLGALVASGSLVAWVA